MSRVILAITIMLFGAMGCASQKGANQAPVYVEAAKVEPVQKMPDVIPVPVVQAMPGQSKPAPRMRAPTEKEIRKAKRKSRGKSTAQVIKEANKNAAAQPVEEGYFNAVQMYDYAEGALYQVYTAPMKITAIQLQPGERIISVASGDTVRWIIAQTSSGSGPTAREVVFLKPVRSGLHSNLIIMTDRHIYQLEIHSFKDTYMASVSWQYPMSMVREQAQRKGGGAKPPVELASDVTGLNFGYGFVVNDPEAPPSWMPRRVYDDGVKTYIQFGADLQTSQAPALFVLSASGKPQIVNYRVQGEYYIVDRTFGVAQLRLGEESDAVTVGIERLGGR